MGSFWVYLSVTMLMIIGVLMIFIILLQRGRGGGLAGAFGGAGGQSALGTKAGDVFTKITVGLAVVWVFFACISIYALRYQANAWANELPDRVETEEGALVPGAAEAEDEGASTPAPAAGTSGDGGAASRPAATGDTQPGGASGASAPAGDAAPAGEPAGGTQPAGNTP